MTNPPGSCPSGCSHGTRTCSSSRSRSWPSTWSSWCSTRMPGWASAARWSRACRATGACPWRLVSSMYALVITGLTARYPKRLPTGWWLKIHRFSLVILGAAWFHGLQSGTDSQPFMPIYVGIGAVVVAAAAYRYWVVRRARSAARQPVTPQRPAASPDPCRDRTIHRRYRRMKLPLIRRGLVLTATGASLVIGAAAVQGAAAWAHSSAPTVGAPISATQLQDQLDTEQARSAALQAQVDALLAQTTDSPTALNAAGARSPATSRRPPRSGPSWPRPRSSSRR